MRDHRQYASNGAALKRCAIRDGKFGFVRYYSRRTSFCPRNASIALELAGQVTAIGYPGSKLP